MKSKHHYSISKIMYRNYKQIVLQNLLNYTRKVTESYVYTKIQKDEKETRKQYSRIIRVIEIKASRGLKGHVGGQWAIHHGPLYEIFMVYGHIYLYGHNTIVHTCLHWYNSTTMRQKENDIGEKDGRERNQGGQRSFLAAK